MRWVGQKATEWLRNLTDSIFGYDFFLSYSHADGANYPRRLREALTASGFKVFLDTRDYVAGDDLHAGTRRRVGMSSKLVVVARPAVLRSTWVLREVEAYLGAGRVPIVIDVNGTIASAPDDRPIVRLLRDRIYIPETLDELDGEPSPRVVSELRRGFDATRQETRRLRAMGVVATVLGVLAVAAIWFGVLSQMRNLDLQRQNRVSRVQSLAAQARADLAEGSPQEALLLGVEALRITARAGEDRVLEAEQAVRTALEQAGGVSLPREVDDDARSMVISSDGAKVVIVDINGRMHVVDATDRHAAPVLLGPPDSAIESVSMMPGSRHAATIDPEGRARLWALDDLKTPPVELSRPGERATGFAAAADGRSACVSIAGGVLRVWDCAGPELSRQVEFRVDGEPTAVALSKDGRWVAAGAGGNALVWDRRNPAGAPGVYPHREKFGAEVEIGEVNLVCVSDDGLRVVAMSRPATLNDGEAAHECPVSIWTRDAAGSVVRAAKLVLLDGDLMDVAVGPDARWIGGCSRTGSVRIWDLSAAEPAQASYMLEGHRGSVYSLAMDAGGTVLVSAGNDRGVAVWDLGQIAWEVNFQQGTTGESEGEGGTQPVSESGKSSGFVLEEESERPAGFWLRGNETPVRFVSVSPNGRWVAAQCDAELRVWDLDSPTAIPRARVVARSRTGDDADPLWSTQHAVSLDGRWLVASAGVNAIASPLAGDGVPALLPVVVEPGGAKIEDIGVAPDGSYVVLSTSLGGVHAGTLSDRAETIRTVGIPAHGPYSPAALGLGPGGLLARADGRGDLRVWRAGSAEPVAVLVEGDPELTRVRGSFPGLGRIINPNLAIAPKKDRLFLINETGHLVTWRLDAPDPRASRQVLPGSDYHAFAFSPDGRWLVTHQQASGKIDVWDLGAANLTAPKRLLSKTKTYSSMPTMVLDPGGRFLITGGDESGPERLWDLASGSFARPYHDFGPDGISYDARFSPDGRWLYNGSDLLWDMQSLRRKPVAYRLDGHPSGVREALFDAKSRWLLTASWETDIAPYGASDPDPGTGLLWDLRMEPPRAVRLRGSGGNLFVDPVAINGEAGWVMTVSESQSPSKRDLRIALWPLEVDPLIATAGETTGRNLSLESWRRAFPGEPYRPVFPKEPFPPFDEGFAAIARDLTPEEWETLFPHEPFRRLFPPVKTPPEDGFGSEIR